MKGKILLVILFAIVSASVHAQKLVFLFGHAEYASVSGDLKNSHDKGLGVEAGIGAGLSKTFFIGTIGSTWLKSTGNNAAGTLRYSPVKVGIRRYILLKNLFIKGDIGLANMKYSNGGSATSHLTTGIGAGLKFTGIEVIGDYTNVGSFGSWISVKAGFTIGI